MNVSALFVEPQGVYSAFPGVDAWDQERDARLYKGPHPVVAHPPCERWGRYWSGGPSAKVKRLLGDDGGCFESALMSVCDFGGVLEHPEASHAFKHHGLPRPSQGSWQRAVGWPAQQAGRVYVTQVAQSAYGHKARKLTWLVYCGAQRPLDLDWSVPKGERLDEGFHSQAERVAARAAGQKPIQRLSRAERLGTPLEFAKTLIRLANFSRLGREAIPWAPVG